MSLPVDLLQPFDTRMRVDLGSRDGRVSEQLLHRAEIDKIVAQISATPPEIAERYAKAFAPDAK